MIQSHAHTSWVRCLRISRWMVADTSGALDHRRRRQGLEHRRERPETAFDHLERDLECLTEIIGRLLTIAKLDTTSTPIGFSRGNISELVAALVVDAGFEAK